MPIKFINLNEEFTEKIKKYGYESYTMRIEKYQPIRKTYYVSAANSMCTMGGGIDYSLSRFIFPGIAKQAREMLKKYGKKNQFNIKYLPIGSSMIIDVDSQRSLIMAPTMLMPREVSKTQNAYYSTMAILYNILINRRENLDEVDILFTSLCCGCGKMSVDESIKQTLQGIQDFPNYRPKIIDRNAIICEPNLEEQPGYQMSVKWQNFH